MKTLRSSSVRRQSRIATLAWLCLSAVLLASCGETTTDKATGDSNSYVDGTDSAGSVDVVGGDSQGNDDISADGAVNDAVSVADSTAGDDATAEDSAGSDDTSKVDTGEVDSAGGDDTTATDSTGTDATQDDGTVTDGSGDDATSDTTDPDTNGDTVNTACPGGVGCSCKLDSDCGSAACVVWSNGTKQCAKPCGLDDDCGKGEVCDGPADSAVCLPKAIALCAPCLGNNECQIGAPGGACVNAGAAGAFCGTACAIDADCPAGSGSVCVEVKDIEGQATKQCVPAKDATCDCSDYAIAKFAKTLCFADGQPGCAATRQCLPAGATGAPDGGGLSICAPQPASAEICDGIDNDCDGQTDEGGADLCDDSNVCTLNTCEAGKGCVNTPAPGACNDDDACTDKDSCALGLCVGTTISCDDGDTCTADSCDPLKGCQYAPISATDTVLAPCNDNNACTENDSCNDGKCAGTKLACDDANPCTNDACDLATGCTATANSAKCNDSDACTSGDTCVASVCVGAKVDCDDNNVCTDDSCDAAKGCQHLYAKGDCDDGNACTLKDTCVNGDCKGTLLDELQGKGCEDDNPCTDVACDLAIGCTLVNNTKACNDGDACTDKDTCKGGSCSGADLNCDDENVCTNDSCDKLKGCVNTANTASCNDGDPCTEADACAATLCKGTAKNCDDGNACTGEACKDGVCLSEALTGTSCSDSSACSSGDTCSADGACTGKPISCDDGNFCTDDPCDPKAGCAAKVKSTKPCDDGTACTKDDTCDGKGNCKGAVVDCNDDNACTADSCDPASGCVNKATTEPCSDGTACTTQDTCQDGKCVGVAANCDDGNPCTTDGCDKSGGCTYTNNTIACDDGDTCTELDACNDGKCAGKAKNCDDDNTCTADACKGGVCLSSALTGTGCDDGTACSSSDLCDGVGKCAGKVISCDDGNPCTDDACDPKVGCAAKTPNTKPCDDGSACTKDDTCDGKGACKGAPLITADADACDDNNSCTTDGCDPATGCFHKANTLPCDDGDSCTGGAAGDKCGGGKCVPGAQVCKCKIDTDCDAQNPNPCLGAQICTAGQCALKLGTAVTCTDDGDSCSLEACDPKTGTCATTPAKDGVACDKDGTVCTANDACAGGKCTAGKVVDCDDSNPCTQDSCNKLIGCVHAATAGACSDGDACTDKDACVNGSCAPGAKLDCDDANACTKDACDAKAVDASAACTHTGLDATPCDDGNPCSEADSCAKGVCKAGTAKDCTDADKCLSGKTCDVKTGSCGGGTAKSCDDGNACTTDLCDAKTGNCAFAAIAGCKPPCSADGDCDDGNPCTNDSCDLETAKCVNQVEAGIICPNQQLCNAQGKCAPMTAGWARSITSSDYHFCAITWNGHVACWGSNNQYQLGGTRQVGTPTLEATPLYLPKPSGVTSVCAGNSHSCALTSSGEIWCWGNNNAGKFLPSSAGSTIKSPTKISDANDFVQLGCWQDTCGVHKDGSVTCWGSTATVAIGAAATGISQVALSESGNCFLRTDGALACWGDNYGRQISANAQSTYASPTIVAGAPAGAQQIATFPYGIAVRTADNVSVWGTVNPLNIYQASAVAATLLNLPSKATALSARPNALLVPTESGKVYGAGTNNIGQFFATTPTTLSSMTALPLPTGTRGVDAASTNSSICVVTSLGQVLCAGGGLLGDGSTSGSSTLAVVTGPCATDSHCDDGAPCTTDSCDTTLGRCSFVLNDGKACDDGLACTGDGSCSGMKCVAGTVKSCDDNNACTTDTCSSKTGDCSHNFNAKIDCDDGKVCTTDACDPKDASCSHNVEASNAASCDDGQPCTKESCDASTGSCAYAPVVGCAWSCKTNLDCATGDSVCSGGICGTDGTCTFPSGLFNGVSCGTEGQVCGDGICGPPKGGWATAISMHPFGDLGCFLAKNGDVYCISKSITLGQVGDLGASAQKLVKVAGISNAAAVSSGNAHACALRKDGKVLCWGYSGLGQIVANKTKIVPATEVPEFAGSVQVVAGSNFTCALTSTGAVSCIGSMSNLTAGAIVDGSASTVLFTDVRRILSASNTLCVESRSGTVRCIGSTQPLTGGSTTAYPAQILRQAFGSRAYPLGSLTIWIGDGGVGMCSGGGRCNKWSGVWPPQRVLVKPEGNTPQPINWSLASAAGGATHSMVVLQDGDVYGIGGNKAGTMGLGTATFTNWGRLPIDNVTQVAGSQYSTCALRADGMVWCTGEINGSATFSPLSPPCNIDADCADGSACTTNACVAGACTVSVVGGPCDDGDPCTLQDGCSGGVCLGEVVAPCDDNNPCTVDDFCTGIAGKAECVGRAAVDCDDGAACTADSCDVATGMCKHVAIGGCVAPCTNDLACSDGDPCTTDVCSNGTCKLTTAPDGTECGFVGQACSAGSCAGTPTGWAKDLTADNGYHMAARTPGGDLYQWGYNSQGELGTGDKEPRVAPTLVQGVRDVVQVAVGASYTCALTRTRRVWCWGLGTSGQLGNGRPASSLVPRRAAKLDGSKAIALMQKTACAITSGGRIACVGADSGDVGDGNTGPHAWIPREIALSITFNAVYTSNYGGCGRASSSGNVYCWGNNQYRILQYKNVSSLSTPVLRTGATGAQDVAFNGYNLFVVLDGALYATGGNPYGEWGIGASNVQVGPEFPFALSWSIPAPKNTAVAQVEAAGLATVLRMDNGELYGGGTDSNGQLGLGYKGLFGWTKLNTGLVATDVAGGYYATCVVDALGKVRCSGSSFANGSSVATVNFGPVATPCKADGDCSDGNACTTDACAQNVCAFTAKVDGICDDGDPCTVDTTCQAGACKGTVAPCSDSDACTDQDACVAVNGKASCIGKPKVICNDNKPCTADSCDPKTGACVYDAVPGCAIGCQGNADCDDGLACSTDTCNPVTGVCSYKGCP